MVNWWFGSRWFGILGVPLSNSPFPKIKGIPQIQTTGPQTTKLTISWQEGFRDNLCANANVKNGNHESIFPQEFPKGTCLYGKGIYLKLFIVYV